MRLVNKGIRNELVPNLRLATVAAAPDLDVTESSFFFVADLTDVCCEVLFLPVIGADAVSSGKGAGGLGFGISGGGGGLGALKHITKCQLLLNWLA